MSLVVKSVSPGSKEELDFLILPHKLYTERYLMQSATEEQEYIAGQAVLSPTLSFNAFVGYLEEEPQIRAALIQLSDTAKVYVGFFEAVNDQQVMEEFITYLKDCAKAMGATHLIGPVQGSFWTGYRMKMNQFNRLPFTGEPHNPAYYPELWQTVGFELKERYLSNFYQKVPQNFKANRLEKRFNHFINSDYKIVTPNKTDWNQTLKQVFDLLSELYNDFPLYQSIDFETFKKIFDPLRHMLDFSMVQLAYKEKDLVGFLITVPDYGNLVYRPLTLWNLFKIMTIRKKAKRYIVLYLGVEAEHLGLGSALTYPIFKEIEARKAEAVGALIHHQTVTKSYVKELQQNTTQYVLFEIKL